MWQWLRSAGNWVLRLYRAVQDLYFAFTILVALGVGALAIGTLREVTDISSVSAILIGAGGALVSLPVLFPLVAWLVSLADSRQPKPENGVTSTGAIQAVPISEIKNCVLNMREHCGVKWRPRITADSVSILGPFCPEDEERLQYRMEFTDLERRIERMKKLAQPLPEPFKLANPPGLNPTPSPTPPAETEEEKTFEIRELRGTDRSDEKRGPYCEECGRLRRMPKTVDECRLEVLESVRKALRLTN